MGKLIEEIDVIAQFKHDGEIIPMRLQMLNSAGQPEAYTIKGYRRLANKGTYTSVHVPIIPQDSLALLRLLIPCSLALYSRTCHYKPLLHPSIN